MLLQQKTPKLKDAFNLLSNKSFYWKKIGIQLDISKDDRKHIEASHDDYYDCLEELLIVWLQQEGDPPTWDQLLKSLEALDYYEEIRRMQEFLETDTAIKRYS